MPVIKTIFCIKTINFNHLSHYLIQLSRKLEWDISHLTAGEERVFTYIIYSKINIIGSFELPSASIAFEHNGQREHVFSNKTYFAAETTEN